MAPGQNVFVRGLPGTGRLTMVRQLLEDIRPACPLAPDHCYVHNFSQPDRPRLITVGRGKAVPFAAAMDVLIDFVSEDLAAVLISEGLQARRKAIDKVATAQIERVSKPFDSELQAAGLGLIMLQVGYVSQPAIVPLVGNKPIPTENLERLVAEGKIDESRVEELLEKIDAYGDRLEEIGSEIRKFQERAQEQVAEFFDREIRQLMLAETRRVLGVVSGDEIESLLGDVVDDLVNRLPQQIEDAPAFSRRYRVNVIRGHRPDEACPIIIENVPSVSALLGSIDIEVGPEEHVEISHMGIRAGSLLEADGGYLIMEARDVATDPESWRALVRVLRARQLDIVPPDLDGQGKRTLKPDPIPISVKIVLLGEAGMYEAMEAGDPDFANLFKVLADFETMADRDERTVELYAGVLARMAAENDLLPFHRTAVAELFEHGVRIAGRRGKVSLRFGRIYDIAWEAAFLASKGGQDLVLGEHVADAIERTKRRADLPARRFGELVSDGTILIQTNGVRKGQVNGLAVSSSGPLSYGFPARITATVGPGSAGAINIERESALSGAIHTKGFYILGGLLRSLLPTDHPLAFSASVAFEQTYGGIDGDSASGAEICSLISALTGVPLRQDLAMTGAIDQLGNILPVGAVNEKIEGYYDVCLATGLSGTQGVIIPGSNAGDLMLRDDVVAACEDGRFAVYAVDTIHQALELFTGRPAGELDADGAYPEGSVLELARTRARQLWDAGARDGRPDRS
jgi:ATP-dependent Lon protease